MTTRTTAQDLVNALWDAWKRHDVEAIASMYADGAIVHDPGYAEPLAGKDAIKKDASDFFTAFPDLAPRVTKVIAEGDSVSMEGVATGTHSGPFALPTGVVPPTNKPVNLRIAMFMELDGSGSIREERRYYDVATMLSQLGLMQ